MPLIFRNDAALWRRWPQSLGVRVFAYLALLLLMTEAKMFEGDSCTTKGIAGVCKQSSNCTTLEAMIKRGDLTVKEIEHCGFNIYEEVICCPINSSSARPVTRLDERPAVRACRELDKDLQPSLTPQIIGGTAVALGDFPHMAAIGYSQTADSDQGPYDFDCGGTLIEKRFVLTAAHCINNRKAVVVRLGVTDFADAEQMRDAVEIRIKNFNIHPDYSSLQKIHDIAIIELERDVMYTKNIYPTCLYVDIADPPADSTLYVTGWGEINTKSRAKSNVLLKAMLAIEPFDRCVETYRSQSIQLVTGNLCAHDASLTRDSCHGDSGGPLSLVVDYRIRKFRVVGVITGGFSCASRIPAIYTRVASYIDYIEGVVWPGQ